MKKLVLLLLVVSQHGMGAPAAPQVWTTAANLEGAKVSQVLVNVTDFPGAADAIEARMRDVLQKNGLLTGKNDRTHAPLIPSAHCSAPHGSSTNERVCYFTLEFSEFVPSPPNQNPNQRRPFGNVLTYLGRFGGTFAAKRENLDLAMDLLLRDFIAHAKQNLSFPAGGKAPIALQPPPAPR